MQWFRLLMPQGPDVMHMRHDDRLSHRHSWFCKRLLLYRIPTLFFSLDCLTIHTRTLLPSCGTSRSLQSLARPSHRAFATAPKVLAVALVFIRGGALATETLCE